MKELTAFEAIMYMYCGVHLESLEVLEVSSAAVRTTAYTRSEL